MNNVPEHFLSVCLIAKNEAHYLPEWLEYHLMIGVDHFYIYDNGSDDDIEGACRAHRDRITLIDWPIRGSQQRLAYIDFVNRYAGASRWTAFIDADEFIFYDGPFGFPAYLAQQQEDVAGIELPWVIFDTNGHERRPEGLVLENYTRAHRVAPQINVKTVCRAGLVNTRDFCDPHRFKYTTGRTRSLECNGEAALYHYMIRSRQEVVSKVSRGDAWSPETERKRLADIEKAVRSILDKYDNADTDNTNMLRLVPELKRRLAIRVAAAR